jgi:alpha-1,3-rhamnosyl/mannosyltransferase
MNVCIDMRPALSNPTGVGVYLQNLVRSLAALDETTGYHLFSSSWSERFHPSIWGSNFHVHDLRIPVRILNFAWNRLSFPAIDALLRLKPDVVHSPTPLVIPSTYGKAVTTIYDLYFYLHPEHTQAEIKRDYAALVAKNCERSDAIIAISEYTKQQLVEHLKIAPSSIYTIHLGVDDYYSVRTDEDTVQSIKNKFGITRPYFLFVGNLEPRKNLPQLMKAFRTLKEDFQLVLAGPKGWLTEEWSDLVTDRTILTGYVTKEELRALYQNAIALVLVSVEEGFSLPAMEAMASSTPVLASNLPIFREIGGNAFLPVDQNDSDSIRDAMLKIANDSGLRKELTGRGLERSRRFSWRETAQKTLNLYKNL